MDSVHDSTRKATSSPRRFQPPQRRKVHVTIQRTRTKMVNQANQRKVRKVASVAAGVTDLATAAAVVIHRRRQYARAQHPYQ